jgi:hypothetical protein
MRPRETLSVIASFGATRVLTFQRDESINHVPLTSGSVMCFGRTVNERFLHGIEPLRQELHSEGRISIAIWGSSRLPPV